MHGADEGRSREKVSWASVNAADTSLEVRDEVAASSRAELKEVVMDHPSGPKPHRFICENRVPPLPGGEFALCVNDVGAKNPGVPALL